MKKIRIGNDIVIKWRITINGEEVNLEGLDLSLYISTTYQPRKAIAFTVAGNEITATYKGAEQKVSGVYRLTLYRNEGENAQSILDACDAFELVSCSCLTVDAAFGGAEVELPIADLGIGVPGLSAYEIAVAEGFKGTQAEWLASLSAASEAAAAECREFTDAAKIYERERQNNEVLRVTAEDERAAAETARQSSEATRLTNERSRTTAENERTTNETARINAESSRATAETARQEAESARQKAEQGRATAEQQRADAEAARAEEFATFEGKIAAKEDAANKVTSINAGADDVHYPSAKAVRDAIQEEVSQSGQNVSSLQAAIDMTEENLSTVAANANGFITETGDLNMTITNAYITKYKVNPGYGIKVKSASPNAPRKDAMLWAIYSSTTVFDSTTLIAISATNAKSEVTEIVTIPASAKVLILQKFYSGTNTAKLLQNTALKAYESVQALANDVSKKKRSNVFIHSAIVDTSLPDSIKDKYLDGIVSLKVRGISNKDKYIVSKFTIGVYGQNQTIEIWVSKIDNDTLTNLLTFYTTFESVPIDGTLTHVKVVSNNSKGIYFAECIVDLAKIGTDVFNNVISSVDADTYKNYGLSPDCFEQEDFKSALPLAGYGRLRREVRKVEVSNLDNTRSYLLKKFGYDPSNNYLTLEICTTENFVTTYSINSAIGDGHAGIETLVIGSIRITLDFDVINNSSFAYFFTADSIPDVVKFSLDVLGFENTTRLLAEEELALTYNGAPMRLLAYGNISKKFYLSCRRKLYATSTISKQAYTDSDLERNLELLYTFSEESVTTSQDFIVGINALRELNNGLLIVNAAVDSYSDANHTDKSMYSIFYRYDGHEMVKLFNGSYTLLSYTSGITKSGGKWTAIWDFDNYENLVFITERCNQGVGGRAWMSKDGGYTWYVIFNAFTSTNYELYKVVQPSGWDPENNDFQRPVTGTPSYPYSFFHIHGIAYDRWRDNVIIVSGDATWVKGSYTAVWILHNPAGCTIYPASGDIPEGATSAANSVKMLQCNWTRVGLYNDENPTGKNLQFVNTLPFDKFILFGSDCGGGGVNGIIMNNYPQNIVGANFSVKYPLNADTDNALTHSSGGILKLINGPYLWTFHREGSGFSPTSSDQKAAILSSYDGIVWKRAWDDDTFNYDEVRGTKISWGATVIGYEGELYLRYKGFNLNDNIIRRMILRE